VHSIVIYSEKKGIRFNIRIYNQLYKTTAQSTLEKGTKRVCGIYNDMFAKDCPEKCIRFNLLKFN